MDSFTLSAAVLFVVALIAYILSFMRPVILGSPDMTTPMAVAGAIAIASVVCQESRLEPLATIGILWLMLLISFCFFSPKPYVAPAHVSKMWLARKRLAERGAYIDPKMNEAYAKATEQGLPLGVDDPRSKF